ncbi:GNAT family N-acetyltransferase [Skermania piniformis]|uniref:N-acetyltransferase n=1 Tax=Skermania pinensis TaxID=39122 RepID=A0ABX8S509_9ACTN|nr:N-acetyltransferase [Skermania piniformis]QXQ12838.1 N-acetyltransferase [Skermania piniformis]
MTHIRVRPETAADVAAVRAVELSAFPTAAEADLVTALRADPAGWIDGLSMLALTPDETPIGHALLTRCHIGDVPALALAPCAVTPGYQRRGVGTTVIRAALAAAGAREERFVVVLGHPEYYPRFGFERADRFGIELSIPTPAEALRVLSLDPADVPPAGRVRYPTAFGI